MKNELGKSITTTDTEEKPSGPLPFRMTSDILFKILLQRDNNVLKSISCSILGIDPSTVRSIIIENPISLSNELDDKEMILDVKANMNDKSFINLEMQVLDLHDWPERSLSYLCRCFDNLKSGNGYLDVQSAVHIGFLDYTLFPEDDPEFVSEYRIINTKTKRLYSSKVGIYVVNLNNEGYATDDDIKYHRNLWARFFKAKTWEDLYMLAEKDNAIDEAIVTLRVLTKDEEFKQRYLARLDYERVMRDQEIYAEGIKKENIELKNALADKDAALADKDAEITRLRALLNNQ